MSLQLFYYLNSVPLLPFWLFSSSSFLLNTPQSGKNVFSITHVVEGSLPEPSVHNKTNNKPHAHLERKIRLTSRKDGGKDEERTKRMNMERTEAALYHLWVEEYSQHRKQALPHRSVDLNQGDVGLLVHVLDLGVKRVSALQLHLEETELLV